MTYTQYEHLGLSVFREKPLKYNDKDATSIRKHCHENGHINNSKNFKIMVNPTTSCTLAVERSLSTTRRLKTWRQSTMKSKRFNNLTLLHVHKDLTNKLDMYEVGREFVSVRENRQNYFGQFQFVYMYSVFH